MFRNRTDAANQLLEYLQDYRQLDAVVISIPRGGVPIGYHLARNLDLPLDIALTKKVGHPLQKELAIGAVNMNSIFIDPRYGVSKSYIEEEIKKIRKELQRKYALYRGQKEAIALNEKYLILTDDGVATGSTMYTTIKLVKQENPAAVTVAVPVSAKSAKERLKSEVNDYISLLTPPDFGAVSKYYKEYHQVSDEEVIALLNPEIY